MDVSWCFQVPRRPRQQPRRPGATPKTRRATRASPVPQVPHLPRQSKLCDDKLCVSTWCDDKLCVCVSKLCVWASCARAPRLPRATKMDVSKCHACHANSRGVPAPHLKSSAPPEPAQCHKCHTCHARVEADVTKYHTSHVKRRWMFHDVSKCHACRANSRGVAGWLAANEYRTQTRYQCNRELGTYLTSNPPRYEYLSLHSTCIFLALRYHICMVFQKFQLKWLICSVLAAFYVNNPHIGWFAARARQYGQHDTFDMHKNTGHL